VTEPRPGGAGWLAAAGLLGAAAVALGAFGAHALEGRLDAAQLATWRTAVLYHLTHAAALLAVVLAGQARGRIPRATCWLFALGIALFSGSLYGMVLTDLRAFGPLTPLGGLLLLAGWLSLLRAGRP